METPTPTPTNVYEYADEAPVYVGAIAELWSWSLNYDLGDARRPFPLFLDLIGYSQETYGTKSSVWAVSECEGLGWIELDLLGKALCEYADRPRECDDWLNGLMALSDE